MNESPGQGSGGDQLSAFYPKKAMVIPYDLITGSVDNVYKINYALLLLYFFKRQKM